jgi:hypothetical protein
VYYSASSWYTILWYNSSDARGLHNTVTIFQAFVFRYIDDVLSLNNFRFGDYLFLIYLNELWVKDTTNIQKTNDTTQTDQQNSQDQNTHPMEAVQKREGHSTDYTLEAGRKRLLRTVTTLVKAWKIVTVLVLTVL